MALLLVHLGVLYVCLDAKIYPQEGGTVSIGIVNTAPSINPIYYGENPTRDFVLQFLYRSLLKYDNPTKQMG